MLAHNWVYQTQWATYRCEPLGFGSQPSADRCTGCGLAIADRLLQRAYGGGKHIELGIKTVLDMIAAVGELSGPGQISEITVPLPSLVLEGGYSIEDTGDTSIEEHVLIDDDDICESISLALGLESIKRVRITVEVLER